MEMKDMPNRNDRWVVRQRLLLQLLRFGCDARHLVVEIDAANQL